MTSPIRVLVADDEPLARSGVVELLRADPAVTVVGECGDGAAAVEAIRELSPDLVLLDVQMPVLDGFEVIDQVGPERMPAVIFITAFDEYAVRAFQVHAFDYLLKPFDDERFAEALRQAKRRLAGDLGEMGRRLARLLADAGSTPAPRYLSRVVVRKPSQTVLLPVDDIEWIEAADYCVKIHAAGRAHVIRDSMQRMEDRLDPARFFRAHRSGIVNLDRIRELQPGPSGDHILVLASGARVRLSRSRRAALEERLGQPL